MATSVVLVNNQRLAARRGMPRRAGRRRTGVRAELDLGDVGSFERRNHSVVDSWIADERLKYAPGFGVTQALLQHHLFGLERRQKVRQQARRDR